MYANTCIIKYFAIENKNKMITEFVLLLYYKFRIKIDCIICYTKLAITLFSRQMNKLTKG